jgi:hypothetical protein
MGLYLAVVTNQNTRYNIQCRTCQSRYRSVHQRVKAFSASPYVAVRLRFGVLESRVVGYDAILFGKFLSTLRKLVLFLDYLDLNAKKTILRNVGNYLQSIYFNSSEKKSVTSSTFLCFIKNYTATRFRLI